MSDEYSSGSPDSGAPSEGSSAPSSDGGAQDRRLSYSEAKREVLHDPDTPMDGFASLLKVDMDTEKRDPVKAREERAQIARDIYEERQRLRADEDPVEYAREQTDSWEARRQNDIEEATLGATFRANAQAFTQQAPDFTEAVQIFDVLPIENKTFERLVRQSRLGPEIIYRASKSPALLDAIDQLNSSDEKETHRYFGMFEAQVAADRRNAAAEAGRPGTPQVRRQTAAPPPLRTLSGGAAAPVSDRTGPEDMGAFAKWLAQKRANRK